MLCGCVAVNACMWRPEVDTGCLPRSLFHIFDRGSLIEAEDYKFGFASSVRPHPPLSTGVRHMQVHTWLLCECPESELQASDLLGKPFIDWALSSALLRGIIYVYLTGGKFLRSHWSHWHPYLSGP